MPQFIKAYGVKVPSSQQLRNYSEIFKMALPRVVAIVLAGVISSCSGNVILAGTVTTTVWCVLEVVNLRAVKRTDDKLEKIDKRTKIMRRL